MARSYGSKGKERVLRKSDRAEAEEVSNLTSKVIAALSYALNQLGYYFTVGKPSYSGGFYVTVYENDDKTKTYFAAHDEPGPIAHELLDVVAGREGTRLFESLMAVISPSETLRGTETPEGKATVTPTTEKVLEAQPRVLRGRSA